MERILVVEDSPETQMVVTRTLGARYKLVKTGTTNEARAKMRSMPFDLVLLDVMLPDQDGFQFCAELRSSDEFRDLPIVFLTGRSEITDKVMGFSLGADDYVSKPFDPLELRARIEAKLSRVRVMREPEVVIRKGGLRIDLQAQRASIIMNEADGRDGGGGENGMDRELDLTPIEFKLLCHFARNESKVLSRAQLIFAAWGDEVNVHDRTIDKHVCLLRRKLTDHAGCIETVSGAGYRFSFSSASISASSRSG